MHALKRIHGLLKPGGVLIDLRPKGNPADFWGYKGEDPILLGHLEETDNFVEYHQAAQAMEEAIEKGWFQVQRIGEFDFAIHADSLEQMRDYLAIEWTDAVIPEEVWSNAQKLGPERITLRDLVHIGILQAA